MDYFIEDQPELPVRVQMHLDAVDGIARDAMEGAAGVGGLLLGHVEPGDRPLVWIDKYHRVIDDADHRALEEAASSIARESELSVVGFYRSQARPEIELEPTDLELADRYFTDVSDVILLVHASNQGMSGRFFAGGTSGAPFPFRGRAASDEIKPDTARTNPPEKVRPDIIRPEKMRRIVPDFVSDPVQPEAPRPALRELPQRPAAMETELAPEEPGFWRKWLPLIGALLLVGGAVWFLLLPSADRREAAPQTSAAAPTRPLGLYVDPSGDNWRVSWNPAGTALQGARSVSLFVRDGEDQNRIDLSAKDLQSGTYQYQPKGGDVTFRLEVAEASGRLSAESFRFLKGAGVPAPVATSAKPTVTEGRVPRAVRRVAPVVPASIRPRIRGSIPIDVRVVVDARGRVTSAVPASKHSGLQSFLADRAVIAARQWRFEAGAGGSETIHFVFEK